MAFAIEAIPSSGKTAMGRSAVTSMSTASVIHHVAIQATMASVARPATVNCACVDGPVA